MNTTHELKGSYLNLSFPQPKPGQAAQPAYGDGAAQQGMMPGAAGMSHHHPVDPYRGTTGNDAQQKAAAVSGYYNSAYTTPYHHQQIGPQQPVRWNR